MSAFVDALRAADKAASLAPWEWESNQDGYPTELLSLGVGVIRPEIAVSPKDGRLSAYLSNDAGSAEVDHPDFALIVLLRNAAPEIAALVEAAALVIKHRWPREGHLQPSLEQLESALADLDAKGGGK